MAAEKITEKYKHVIWDWNGTILDDSKLCAEIINNILAKRNLPPITLEEYRQKFTFPVIDYYKAVGLDVSGNNFEIMSHEFIDDYESNKLNCNLFPGAKELLEHFKKHNITQSVLSAYSQHTLEEVINHFGLSNYFIKLVGLNNIYAASKLDNGIKWIKELNINPKEVLMIGDTLHDYEVANEMGIDCVLFSGGHQAKEKLEAANIAVIMSHLQLLRQ